jgi:hypothetical protein
MIQDGDNGNRPIVDGEVRDAIRTNSALDACDYSGSVIKSAEKLRPRTTSDVIDRIEQSDIRNSTRMFIFGMYIGVE